MNRVKRSGVSVVHGGCYVCHGTRVGWEGRNTAGVAARHYYATGHPCWVDQILNVRYGTQEEHEAAFEAALSDGR